MLGSDRRVRSMLCARAGLALCLGGGRSVRDRWCGSVGLVYGGLLLLVWSSLVGVSRSRSSLVHWMRLSHKMEGGHYVREEARVIGIFVGESQSVDGGKASRQVWQWLWESLRSKAAICIAEEAAVSGSALHKKCMKVS